ncbi:MAG: serine--tRNA ligase [Longimicrobiales bacterium]
MLELRQVREDPDLIRERLRLRGNPDIQALIDRVLALDERRRALISQVEELKAERNAVSPRVGELKKAGQSDEANRVIAEMRTLADRISELDGHLGGIETELRDLLLEIPNLPDPDVPPGGEDDKIVVREWGDAPAFDFEPAPHWEIAERLGILDLPRGAKVAGSGFPLYSGAGARLERALINFMMDLHAAEHGYREMWPPFLVNEKAPLGTGQLPKFGDDMYHVPLDGLYLVPTAEVPITNLHAGELLRAEDLPIAYVAYSPCFRREAGAHGKDTRGLLRLHQFDKVELVRFETPQASAAALESLLGHAETVLQTLGLRYRVVLLAGGDLGFANAKTYDLEVWAPAVQRWLEVSSCSLYTDFQARRANIRFRPGPRAKPEFVHTLNGSALALARTLAALLEVGQRADGSVELPTRVADYMGIARIEPA